jgi:hypothetical protein
MLLDRYNTSEGDTFTIGLSGMGREYSDLYVILEFSSDTQYSYYFWATGIDFAKDIGK